jgi:hypothetical protein
MTFDVYTSISRTLTLDYFDISGDQYLSLTIIPPGASSATDSANIAPTGVSGTAVTGQVFGGMGYTIANSKDYGYSSLTLNGVLNLSTSTSPILRYSRYYAMTANTSFRVEFSSDGGFTWDVISSENLDGVNTLLPPANIWETRTVSIPAGYRNANFALRFRLDTRAAPGATGDGVWIGSVEVLG